LVDLKGGSLKGGEELLSEDGRKEGERNVNYLKKKEVII